MAITMERKGYGQVEPNHLSGIVTGQIYAQLPAHVKGKKKVLPNLLLNLNKVSLLNMTMRLVK